MKLKRNSFETVLKLFCFSFISLCGQFKLLVLFQFHYSNCNRNHPNVRTTDNALIVLYALVISPDNVPTWGLSIQRLCSRLTALWRYINFVLLLL